MVGSTVLGRAMDLRELGMRDAGSALSGTIHFVRVVVCKPTTGWRNAPA